MGGRQGDIFEIFQNGHIFLKFLFLKNIKKKKRRGVVPFSYYELGHGFGHV